MAAEQPRNSGTDDGYHCSMATARFLHAADLHLGSPLKSLGDAIEPDALAAVKKRVNQAFDRLVQSLPEEYLVVIQNFRKASHFL